MEHGTLGRDVTRTFFLTFTLMGLSACLDDDKRPILGSSASGASATVRIALETRRNLPPRISGAPPFEAVAGSPYGFQPIASDPDGDRLGFSVSNKPGWAEFDPVSGRLSGQPGDGDLGPTGKIVISVSDGKDGAKLPGFSILVTDTPSPTAGSPPSLSGSPPSTALVNEFYSFQPTASDPDGDLLEFGIVNQPAWLLFDSRGMLSGIPGNDDVGTHSGILITVSDGTLTDALGPFDITVTGNTNNTGSHKLTLTWTMPRENEDGTALTDLAGYEIRYGTAPGSYSTIVNISDPRTTSHTIQGLGSGTYYFVTAAYNSLGATSDFSNEVSSTFN